MKQELLATQGVLEELHNALIVRRQVQLTFDRQDAVEVGLRLDEVAQVVFKHPRRLQCAVRDRVHRWVLLHRLILLLFVGAILAIHDGVDVHVVDE